MSTVGSISIAKTAYLISVLFSKLPPPLMKEYHLIKCSASMWFQYCQCTATTQCRLKLCPVMITYKHNNSIANETQSAGHQHHLFNKCYTLPNQMSAKEQY
jgi:hypothetical protein